MVLHGLEIDLDVNFFLNDGGLNGANAIVLKGLFEGQQVKFQGQIA